MDLLSKDHKTPIKTPIKRSYNFYQETIRHLSRDYRTPIKRLQDSYQEITGLLSRDHKTPMNLL